MSFWIWVGVAIVVVLVVAFVRDRLEQRHGGATREVTLNVASKGETLSATRTRASSGEAAAVAGDPSSVPGTTTPFGKPRLGCQPEHQPPLALGVPVGGGKVRVVPTVRQIQRQLGWYEVDGESGNLSKVVCSNFSNERWL